MSERGRRGQETGSRIKPLWDTLSQWDGTQPLPSAGGYIGGRKQAGWVTKSGGQREGEGRRDRECAYVISVRGQRNPVK